MVPRRNTLGNGLCGKTKGFETSGGSRKKALKSDVGERCLATMGREIGGWR